MVKTTLFNTKTRKKEVFRPIDPNDVRMYVCGPTVYERAHLGNARPVAVFDVLYRLLRHAYGVENVRYVRNITDIDDKINARARETGRGIGEITSETARWYMEDMGELGALEPTEAPRATAFVPQMITMIERLIAKGHAYEAEEHVLFAVDSYAGYGALSGRSTDDMIAGARVEVAPYKRNPMDFVLWKPSSPDLPGWESPWGRGRPGWHIECSAMSHELLGESFDIHGGGNDLQFPHHENEIAQSLCACPGSDFARIWMHNEMLRVEGQKMSKSLGNFLTVRDLLDQGHQGETIRLVMLSTHYRKPMDWTARKAEEAKRTLGKWFDGLKASGRGLDAASLESCRKNSDVYAPDDAVVAALCDDLNTPGALAVLHELARSDAHDATVRLLGSLFLLGLINDRTNVDLFSAIGSSKRPDPEVERIVNGLLTERHEARRKKDFARSDRIRDSLRAIGVNVADSPEGPKWSLGPDFDLSRLEALK